MRKSIEFRISNCSENYENMATIANGKYCQSCQKMVVDFTSISNDEILKFLSKSSGNVCGSFYQNQLANPIQIGDTKNRFRYWHLLIASFLSSMGAYSQNCKPSVEKTTSVKYEQTGQNDVVQIRIIDSFDNIPISYAIIKSGDYGLSADSAGWITGSRQFFLNRDFEISAIGYETQKLTSEHLSAETRLIRLNRQYQGLSEVVVVPDSQIRSRLGGLVGSISITRLGSIKDTMASIFSRPLTVFPNPVRAGEILYLKLNVKEFGDYALAVVNSAGQLYRQETFTINVKNQVKMIYLSTMMKGICYIQLESQRSGKKHSTKVVVR